MMRTHIDTHPTWDFAIGYRVPAKKPIVKMCEDCRARPSQPHHTTCKGCGKAREQRAAKL